MTTNPSSVEDQAVGELLALVRGSGANAFQYGDQGDRDALVKSIIRPVAAASGREGMLRVYHAVEVGLSHAFRDHEVVRLLGNLDMRFSGVGGWCA